MSTHDLARAEIEALLDFYISSGIDCFLGEEAVDRFALSEEQARVAKEAAMNAGPAASRGQMAPPSFQNAPQSGMGQRANPSQGQSGQFQGGQFQGGQPQGQAAPPQSTPAGAAASGANGLVIPDQEVVAAAQRAAAGAQTLEELRNALEEFPGCNLKFSAKNLVFADGNPQARVMIIGEAPGRDEDLRGLPFVGAPGQLLDRMLHFIGLDRQSVYMANVVPWRPPGNRAPTPQETEICRPFISRQIELAKPEIVIFLGGAAAKSLLDLKEGIRHMRGRWMTLELGGHTINTLATYQPDYLFKFPRDKRLVWQDLLAIKAKLAERS